MPKQSGWTLTELLVVVAVMAVLLAIGGPAIQKMVESFESSTGAQSVIDAALAGARAMAVSKNAYAGVRFQQDKTGRQYLVFIIYDYDATGLSDGFSVVQGRSPVRLPENMGVLDGKWVSRTFNSGNGLLLKSVDNILSDGDLTDNNLKDGKNRFLMDASTFSIVFSPSGRLIQCQVRVCNVDGITDTNSNSAKNSNDKIFNKKDVVDGKVPNKKAMFYQDDYGGVSVLGGGADFGIAAENSRNSFKIFNKKDFDKAPPARRWTSYLSNLGDEFVNPYTGQLVQK